MRKIIKSGKPIKEEFRKIELARKHKETVEEEHIVSPEEIIEQAQEECNRMKAQVEMEIIEMRDDAKKQAYEEGYAAGLEEGKNELAQVISTLRTAESELHRQKIETLKSAEKELVELSLAIAKKVLRYELEHSREVVLRAVEESIPLLVERDEVLIRVNPEDVKVIQDASERIKNNDTAICKLEIIGDERIAQGGAVVQSSSGSVDSDVAILMENLEKELRAIMPSVELVEQEIEAPAMTQDLDEESIQEQTTSEEEL